MIVDDPVGIAPCPSTITDDLSGNLALWINANVNTAQCHFRWQMRFRSLVFFRGKIGRNLEGQNSAVMVVAENSVVGNPDLAAE